MKLVSSLFLMLYASVAVAQLDHRYNAPRPGDEITKQQVSYKDPGRSGANVIWDFGKLKSINDEYTLVYSEPYLIDESKYIMGWDTLSSNEVKPGELIIGTEHNTMYYYRIHDNTLKLLGHENPVTILRYTPPIPSMIYPLSYGQEQNQEYTTTGRYSSRIPLETSGEVHIQADAYGQLVLPGGDTLYHVLRVKTLQSITDTSGADIAATTQLEKYQWYAKGYRYPVFETIRTYKDEASPADFATAFFYPPQDHFYLDDDPDNLAILDSLWNMNTPAEEIDTNEPTGQNPLTYNFYPNPVQDYLNIEYYLENPTAVTISLYNLNGSLVKTLNRAAQQAGLYHEQLDCTSLSPGTYVLTIQTSTHTITSDKILKK